MTRSHVKSVGIAVGQQSSRLSKGQKVFNSLIKQIEKKRTRLAAWESVAALYQQKYASELVPLIDALSDLQVEIVHRLDRLSDQNRLSKTERRTIANLITHLAGELVAHRNDAQLKAIYNKHSRSDYDSEEAANIKGMQAVLEDVLGFELGEDFDLSSPEDLLQRAQAKIHEQRIQHDAERQAFAEHRAKRTKSAKQLAQEARQATEAREISQSLRELYRKLASALHPDRETDARERERKTALMQRANQAYDKNNLLQLLELQLELEHIDQCAINNISEERLKRYNKILKDQLAELEQELLHVEGRFRAQFSIAPFVELSPRTIMHDLAGDIADVQQAIRDIKADLRVLEGDIKQAKSWLKGVRRRSSMVEFDELSF